VPWGHKAFRGYLGEDRSAWARYDACALLAEVPSAPPLRVDQGAADAFLETQLRPELLVAAAAQGGHALDYHLHDGYDHSYFFIASFIDEHLAFHAEHLAGA
jgi:S-formylglutathione hydrolase